MQLSQVDLNLLRVLDALLDTESVRLASRRLGLSPSATSHALGRLRDVLGDPILTRAGRRLVRTALGETLRPRVREILERTAALFQAEQALDPASMRRTFRLAANDIMEQAIVRPLSARLASLAPGVNLYSAAPRDLVLDLREGARDLGFGVFGALPDDVNTTVLWEERFVCLLRRDHPLARKKLTLERFLDLGHVLVAPGGTAAGPVDTALAAQGLERRIARTVASFLVAPGLVADSDYVMTVSARAARSVGDTLGLVVRDPPLELNRFEVSAVWHRRLDHDAGHRWLRARTLEVARQV